MHELAKWFLGENQVLHRSPRLEPFGPSQAPFTTCQNRHAAQYSSSSSSSSSRVHLHVVHLPSSEAIPRRSRSCVSSSSSKDTPDPSRVFTRLDHAWGSARDTASTIGVCGRRWRLSGAGSSRRSSRYPGMGVGSTIREFSVPGYRVATHLRVSWLTSRS